jgi:hypothetical protein
MTNLAATARAEKGPSIAWNDIEALPIYVAALLGLFFFWSAISELAPSLYVTTMKVVGIVGCIALRYAWLKLDETTDG